MTGLGPLWSTKRFMSANCISSNLLSRNNYRSDCIRVNFTRPYFRYNIHWDFLRQKSAHVFIFAANEGLSVTLTNLNCEVKFEEQKSTLEYHGSRITIEFGECNMTMTRLKHVKFIL